MVKLEVGKQYKRAKDGVLFTVSKHCPEYAGTDKEFEVIQEGHTQCSTTYREDGGFTCANSDDYIRDNDLVNKDDLLEKLGSSDAYRIVKTTTDTIADEALKPKRVALEIGKYYISRKGEVSKVVGYNANNGNYPFTTDKDFTYTADGRYDIDNEDEDDLVELSDINQPQDKEEVKPMEDVPQVVPMEDKPVRKARPRVNADEADTGVTLQVGKKYNRRDGEVVTVDSYSAEITDMSTPYRVMFGNVPYMYRGNGRYLKHSEYYLDIVSEHEEVNVDAHPADSIKGESFEETIARSTKAAQEVVAELARDNPPENTHTTNTDGGSVVPMFSVRSRMLGNLDVAIHYLDALSVEERRQAAALINSRYN